jgi:hypothetical protein
VQHYPSTDFQFFMTIDSDLNKVLLVINLHDAAKDAIAKGFPTCEDLKDLFTDMTDDKTQIEATFRVVVDTKILTDIDIHHVMFVFDWFLANIADPDFAWANFTCAVYVADKLWLRHPRPPLMLQARLPPRTVVISIFLPMCFWLMSNGKPPQLHPAQLQPQSPICCGSPHL